MKNGDTLVCRADQIRVRWGGWGNNPTCDQQSQTLNRLPPGADKILRYFQPEGCPPKARLIWATTTPLRDGKDVTYDTKAEYSDARIAARNALAAEVVAAQKIPTVDLNSAMRGHPEFHSDNVHFNGQGVQILAAQVSAAVEKLLPR